MDDITKTAEDVVAEEKVALGLEDVSLGLAFSGGGIRSASFGMGILQALHEKEVLEKIDYLSTVSGGGYLGSSLTWFLNQKDKDGQDYDTADNFPFPSSSISKDNTPLQFIRHHGKYLTPAKAGLDGASLAAVTLRGMATSLFVYGAFLISIFSGLIVLGGLFISRELHWMESGPASFLAIDGQKIHSYLAGALLLIAVLCGLWFIVRSLMFAIGTYKSKDSSAKRYSKRTDSQVRLGRILTAGISFAVLGSIPFIYLYFLDVIVHEIISAISIFGGAAAAFFRHKKDSTGEQSSYLSDIVIVVFSPLLIYGLLTLSYSAATSLLLQGLPGFVAIAVILTTALIVGLRANLNYSGLNRMYRDRLMETFMPDVESVTHNLWGLAEGANRANIATMCRMANGVAIKRPYHLVNTNINLTDSKKPRYRDRAGDSFLLSPMFIGSDATGYLPAAFYMKERGGMSLATAMSISGAAVNPNSGLAGRGPTTNRFVSTLLALLNLRMGFWATNPANYHQSIPNYINPGLTGGILSTDALNETGRFVELSDGGHFEDLGLYELLRRQLKLIIVSDGGQDSEFQFGDLANATELARTDFGVELDFHRSLKNLLPDSSNKDMLSVEKYHLARQGYAIADITYKNGLTGKLIYLKATMIPDLPTDVLGYKNENPTFPNQTTADQFFDERQFEAYRQLGLAIARDMLAKIDLENIEAIPTGDETEQVE